MRMLCTAVSLTVGVALALGLIREWAVE
jgi:hypothetical protein